MRVIARCVSTVAIHNDVITIDCHAFSMKMLAKTACAAKLMCAPDAGGSQNDLAKFGRKEFGKHHTLD